MAQEGISTAITTTTTWTIKNFTKLPAKKLNSDVFVVGGYKWRLSAFPKGNKVDDHLSLYLAVADSSTFPDGWSIDIESFSITVVSEDDANVTKTRTACRFNAQSTRKGFPFFIRLSNLSDPAKGYLEHDTLAVEARVSVSTGSSSNLLKQTKNLLAELSSMNGDTSGSEISPPNPQSLQQQRKALEDYLVLSVEAIKQTTAFDEIERLALQVQHSSNSTILDNLVSRLATFKGIVPPTMKFAIENVKAHLMSLSEKSADVGARLEQGREQLSSLDAKYSKLSEEELGLEAEILRLTTQKQELLIRKNSVVLELEKINMEKTSKDLAEWRDIIKETKEIDENWLQTREKLVQANLNFKQNLEQCQESGYHVDDTLAVHVRVSASAESSSSTLLEKSNCLLAEMPSLNIAETSTLSNEISDPQSLQQHRKALQDYLASSLVEIDQANAFDEIERIASLISQHSSNSLEKTILEDLVSRLGSFKELLPTAKSTIESAKALSISLSGKSAEVGARVDLRQERLSTLETDFSTLEAEILQLTTQREGLLIMKNSVALELEKLSEEASKDVGEWRDIKKETEKADKKWLQTREELAHANLSWKLFKQNLEQCHNSDE